MSRFNLKDRSIKEKIPSRLRPVVKAILLFLVLVFTVGLIHLTPIRHSLEDIHLMTSSLRAFGGWAPMVFVIIVSMLVAIGVPRLLLCPIGGMAFGFFWGLVWSQIGTMIGYYATFLFVRWSGRDFILKKWPKLNKYRDFFTAKGTLVVLLIRQLPIAGFYINIVMGLTHIRHVNFLIGTLVGILPEAVPATMIGAGLIHFSPGKSMAAITAAAAFFLILWSLVGRYLPSSHLHIETTVKQSIETGKENISV